MRQPADVAWRKALQDVYDLGDRVLPRGDATVELLAHHTMVDMNAPVLINPGRKLGYRFMAAEANWILSGRSDLDSPVLRKSLSRFSDDGRFMSGAYGPEVVSQIRYVVDTLMRDAQSRQAVMTIWRKNPLPSKDIPCTVALQFFLRKGQLHCIATMRSSDLWLGWPYDVFSFTMIAWTVSLMLGYGDLGWLRINAGSMHIYERDFAGVLESLNTPVNNGDILVIDRHGLNTPDVLRACLGSIEACLLDVNCQQNTFFKRLYELANRQNIRT